MDYLMSGGITTMPVAFGLGRLSMHFGRRTSAASFGDGNFCSEEIGMFGFDDLFVLLTDVLRGLFKGVILVGLFFAIFLLLDLVWMFLRWIVAIVDILLGGETTDEESEMESYHEADEKHL